MDAKYYNGEPGPEHDPGHTNGQPERYVCLGCVWRGRGSIARHEHATATGHLVVWSGDPRALGRASKRMAKMTLPAKRKAG